MNVEIYIPDVLWHRWKRAYPVGDLGSVVRQAMLDLLKERELQGRTQGFNIMRKLKGG